jgi:three-Cys-motif partner protein
VQDKGFFAGKRSWSRLKDRTLGDYLPPYLAKVAKRRRRIVIVDAFAGAGKFDDGTAGSPLIICQAAEKHAKGRYDAVFINKDRGSHTKLSHLLSRWVEAGSVVTLRGSAEEWLKDLGTQLGDRTVFLYMDPFGLKGCEFSILQPFLDRDRRYSTEILTSLDAGAIHRLATRNVVLDGRKDPSTMRSYHDRLSAVLGGDYWKDLMWDTGSSAEERIIAVMSGYRSQLQSAGMLYTGSCPIRDGHDGKIQRIVTFCSRHEDALVIMNDNMHRAYHEAVEGSRWDCTLPGIRESEMNNHQAALRDVVLRTVTEFPGQSRRQVRVRIAQSHFMEYADRDYNAAVKTLDEDGRVGWEDVRGTRRHNDDMKLFPSDT